MGELVVIQELKRYPEWQEALEHFRSAGFKFGEIVKHEWFERALGLPELNPKHCPPAAYKARQLAYVEGIVGLRDALLVEDDIHLQTMAGVGYRLTPPGEQTGVVMHQARRRIVSTITKAKKGVTHIRRDMLTDEQRAENAEAQSKIAFLSGVARNALPRPFED